MSVVAPLPVQVVAVEGGGRILVVLVQGKLSIESVAQSLLNALDPGLFTHPFYSLLCKAIGIIMHVDTVLILQAVDVLKGTDVGGDNSILEMSKREPDAARRLRAFVSSIFTALRLLPPNN